jgi:hypothetical protein
MNSYTLSINQELKAIACHPGPRQERLAAVAKENFMEIPVVRGGFKSFGSAAITLAGIELAHRKRMRQFSFGRGRSGPDFRLESAIFDAFNAPVPFQRAF